MTNFVQKVGIIPGGHATIQLLKAIGKNNFSPYGFILEPQLAAAESAHSIMYRRHQIENIYPHSKNIFSKIIMAIF